MDEHAFWELIDETRAASGGDSEFHGELLEQRLEALPPEEIVAWEMLWEERHGRAYRWDLWAAAYVLMGGCSDDAFDYFRSWLIGQGRERFEAALADPDSLADLAELGEEAAERLEAESLGYLGMHVYERVTGQELPLGPHGDAEPAGEHWDEEDVERVVPRIAAAVEW